VEEIFTLIYGELVRSGYHERISSGVVVTGGSAELQGITEMAEQVFNAPTRIADRVSGRYERPCGSGEQTDVRHCCGPGPLRGQTE